MIGRVIKGKYKIYDQVGAGGFATVYLGRNLETNEIVAIKVLGEQFTREPRYVERFRREAELATRLRHPNIVRILDHGVEDGMHFLVMQFVEGLTLAEILERRGRLSVEETLSYLEQACAGLEAAYQAGVVHRDIKPANLMITPDGTVKIMDFGIARLESMGSLTQTGMFVGTPRYISPEMARGTRADIRSDLYGLGLLAYEMLTGAPPFDAENPWAVLHQQLEVEPRPLRQLRSDVPKWLESVILRSIAKDPSQRFQTPAEMLAALEQRTPSPTREPGARSAKIPATESGQETGERKGLVLGLVGVVTVLVVGLVVMIVYGLGGNGSTPTPAVTESMAEIATSMPSELPANTPILVVVTNTPEELPLLTTQAPRETGVSPSDTPLLPSPEPSHTPEPAPTDTSTPTALPSQGLTDTPTPPSSSTPGPTDTPKPTNSPTSLPAVALSGRVTFSAGGTLHVVEAATGRDTVPPISGLRQPDFRLDGAEIIANGEGGDRASIVNIDARTGAILRDQTRFTNDFHPFWAPDGARFVYDSLHHGLGNYQMLYIQGLTNSKPQPEVAVGYNGQQIRGMWPIWMQDDWIAFTACDYWPEGSGGSNCGIYRMPSWGGAPSIVHSGSLDMRATDNYGGQLVFMSQETGNWEVYAVSNRGGTARNLSNSPQSQDGLGTFSPDGKLVAFASNRGGGWAVWMVGLDGTGLTKLFDLPAAPTAPWNDESISWGP